MVSLGSIILRDWPNPWGTGVYIPQGFLLSLIMTALDIRGDVFVVSMDFLLFPSLLTSDLASFLSEWSRMFSLQTSEFIGAWRSITKGLMWPLPIILYVCLYITQFLWWSPAFAEQVFNVLLCLLALWITLANCNVLPYLSNIGALVEPLKGSFMCSTQIILCAEWNPLHLDIFSHCF